MRVTTKGQVTIPQEVREDMAVEFGQVFGPAPDGGKDCLFKLAEIVDRSHLPAIRIDCGLDDALLENNRAFHVHLDSLGVPHEYGEFPGGHTWDYWDVHVKDAIAFHRRALGI